MCNPLRRNNANKSAARNPQRATGVAGTGHRRFDEERISFCSAESTTRGGARRPVRCLPEVAHALTDGDSVWVYPRVTGEPVAADLHRRVPLDSGPVIAKAAVVRLRAIQGAELWRSNPRVVVHDAHTRTVRSAVRRNQASPARRFIKSDGAVTAAFNHHGSALLYSLQVLCLRSWQVRYDAHSERKRPPQREQTAIQLHACAVYCTTKQ